MGRRREGQGQRNRHKERNPFRFRGEEQHRRWVRATLIRRAGGRCEACGEAVSLDDGPNKATIDHRVPRSKGGGDHLGNLQLLCNGRKGDQMPGGEP